MGRLHRARWGSSIERLADDELYGRAADALLGHLTECPECAGELEVVRRMKMSLARLGDRRPPELAVVRLRTEASRLGSS